MLPIHERRAAVGGLARLEQERLARLAHGWIERQHRAQSERASARRPLCHHHPVAVHEVQASIGVASGCQLVPDPSRVMGYGPKKPCIDMRSVIFMPGWSIGMACSGAEAGLPFVAAACRHGPQLRVSDLAGG